ncbi:MAG: magnesium transporter CorA family protein [Hydrogenophaga sp.]|jgi:Mg2+ and Co2+ transporter CorA|uniref:magnesium transporter CorA family protein n=1 Tax=Hydrogenophaga sp. TaxID=1904254 RepID=UPI00271A045C|nr:magnesium transporter CorA family protein [Hydrogenophaga sp.]MDO9202049.1 magnesium transporter CorA family protein [Hydrogenophaga sp.]MDO9483946.1 magnesium transporter CorA family protein [Hydrogenophaga sp.]MDO9570083.1 magnesium transporter CorA family protein [Hydrogenophaga sp.]MDP1893989.1 magnesium transporter CorA family protein [Hydrogenophaga sp.]MDP2095616.1 magnesium transporter CorA family protein [Hydrogenophaga sp.]
MRVFHILPGSVRESDAMPAQAPDTGFVWMAFGRREFELEQAALQEALHRLTGLQLVDLHVADLLNNHLPSHFDYTSQYDMLVFRRLAAGHSETDLSRPGQVLTQHIKRGGPPVLRRIDTSPVGFAVFDRVLLTVHPAGCTVLEQYATRLLSTHSAAARAAGINLPSGPADLMLRIVNQMVEGYLDLRRELTRQLDHWQAELLNPKTRFSNWSSLLDARISLHQLDEICEDQRSAIQDWIETLEGWEASGGGNDHFGGHRGLELLKVRSRDVLEHIERVVHHVRRLEQNAETAVQMHFSAQSNRANDTMRTLTALTAIFLPLNLIAGIFGMNFEFIPLLHETSGFWWAMGSMGLIAVVLSVLFWRKRYIAHSGR